MFTKAKDAEAIRVFARERGISRLVHFTPLNNLLGIMNLRGILARRKIEEYARVMNDDFLLDYISYNDSHRFDKRVDCINLSIEHINHLLFRRFREKFLECDNWCVIEIDPICLEKDGVIFTTGNAASSYVRTHGTQSGLSGLQALYADSVVSGAVYNLHMETRSASLSPAYPTNQQAEVLFPEEIPIPLIKALVFENDQKRTLAHAALVTDNNSGIEMPPCIVRASDFAPRA